MSFKSTCPFCGQRYNVDDTTLGQAINCTKCNNAFVLQVDDDTVAPFTPGRGNVIANMNSPATPRSEEHHAKRWLIPLAAIAFIVVFGIMLSAANRQNGNSKGGSNVKNHDTRSYTPLKGPTSHTNMHDNSRSNYQAAKDEYTRLADEIKSRNDKLAEVLNTYDVVKSITQLAVLAGKMSADELISLNQEMKKLDLTIEQERAALERLNARKEELRLKYNF